MFYSLGNAIRVVYQAPKAKSGETVTMEIYDETGNKDIVNFPDVVMGEIGTTGRYEGTFTPDAPGNWTVMIHYDVDKGPSVKQYRVLYTDVEGTLEDLSDAFPIVT